MRKSTICVAAVAMAAVLAVSWTIRSAASEAKPGAEDAARELIDSSGVREQLVPLFKSGIRMQAEVIEREAGIDIDLATINDWIDKNIIWDDFEPGFIEIYTKHFTRDEMLKIAEFQRSPVGQKSIEKMPIIFEESGRLGQRIVQEKLPSLRQALEEAHQQETKQVEMEQVG